MRKPREIRKGATYHVTARVNRRERIFAENGAYIKLFFDYVRRAHKKYTFQIKNICVMSNHVHMAIKPEGSSELADIMKSILGGFARRYNMIKNYQGHVWYDRFRSRIIETFEQFINTLSYISNNPVRAAMVNHPLEYKYGAIYALYSKRKTDLVTLILSIIDGTDTKLRSYYDNYLDSFNQAKAEKTDTSIGFYAGKPGRPKKK